MARSLAQGTAGLPLARGEPADFPTDTDTAIASGIAAAQATPSQKVCGSSARRTVWSELRSGVQAWPRVMARQIT